MRWLRERAVILVLCVVFGRYNFLRAVVRKGQECWGRIFRGRDFFYCPKVGDIRVFVRFACGSLIRITTQISPNTELSKTIKISTWKNWTSAIESAFPGRSLWKVALNSMCLEY